MRLALLKCETLRLKLKSSRSFLAIKRWQRTKIKKVIKHLRSSKLRWAHICAHSRIPVNSRSGSRRAPPLCRHRRPRRRKRRRRRSRCSCRCREDHPSRTRVCRREEQRSIATSLSRGASPGGKPMTPPLILRRRTVIGQHALDTYLPRSSCKHGDHGALPPCPKYVKT
jgi:hypothetical protein